MNAVMHPEGLPQLKIRPEHLALAAAMRPNLRHYTDALRSVRATLQARRDMRNGDDG